MTPLGYRGDMQISNGKGRMERCARFSVFGQLSESWAGLTLMVACLPRQDAGGEAEH